MKAVPEKGDWLSATKWTVGLSIVLTEILFLYFYPFLTIEFIVSSAVVTVAVLIQLSYGIRSDAATPADIVVFIFSWLFLDLAPKIQLISEPRHLVNTSTVIPGNVLITNLICAIFIITFTVTYSLAARRAEISAKSDRVYDAPSAEYSAFGVFVAVAVCVLVGLIFGPYAYSSIDSSAVGSPVFLIIKRFLLFLPCATLLILLNETSLGRSRWIFSRVCILFLLVIFVFATKNALTEKRNALGPLYISLALIAFRPYLRNQNRRFLLLIGAMVLVFPAIEEFTHNHYQIFHGVKISALYEQIVDHYQSINYDAWANTYSTIEIVQRQGMQWGRQLLGSILFFVPSSVWTSKPPATGIFIGNYLIANYRMWFTNLSAPFICEGYLDFGVVGVIMYAAGLGAAVSLLNKMAAQAKNWVAQPVSTYAAIYLMFLLRGSLMVAIAYGVGALLAFYASSILLNIGRITYPRHIGARPSALIDTAGGPA